MCDVSQWAFKEICYTWKTLQFKYLARVGVTAVGLWWVSWSLVLQSDVCLSLTLDTFCSAHMYAHRYIIATDLTNIRTILRGGNQTSKYFNLPPPSLDEYLAPREYLPGPDAFTSISQSAWTEVLRTAGHEVPFPDAVIDDNDASDVVEALRFPEDDGSVPA